MPAAADPNVLLIYTDQWRYDALGCASNDEVITPNLDRLAARGVRFGHCGVQHPLCMPSRYSMLAGRYPSSLGVTHMGVPVPEDAEVLPRILSRFGYRTANFGKLHFLPHANRDHRRPHPPYGFDHAEISDEPGVYPDAYRAWVERHHPDQLEQIATVAHPPAWTAWCDTMQIDDGIDRVTDFDAYTTRVYPGSAEATHSAFVADRTKRYLDARAADRNPFLCVSSFYNPHSPLIAPAEFLEQYDGRTIEPWDYPPELEDKRNELGFTEEHVVLAKRGYYAMCTEVDHHVGSILDHLDESGLADHTVVVFTSDHGEFLGQHLRWAKGYPAPDCVARVPLIVAGPGVAQPGREHAGIVEAVDIVPTLLSLLGRPIDPELEGRSLGSVLGGHQETDADDTPASALIEDTEWKALRTPGFRYLLHRDGTEHLYAEDEPFGEYHDVAGESTHADTLASLRLQMLTKLHRKERPKPRVWPY